MVKIKVLLVKTSLQMFLHSLICMVSEVKCLYVVHHLGLGTGPSSSVNLVQNHSDWSMKTILWPVLNSWNHLISVLHCSTYNPAFIDLLWYWNWRENGLNYYYCQTDFDYHLSIMTKSALIAYIYTLQWLQQMHRHGHLLVIPRIRFIVQTSIQ